LIAGLKIHGFPARHIAQEHSYTPDMWQRLANPKLLIYLDVTYPISMQRRPLDMTAAEFEEQKHRLEHARQHASYYLHTDDLSPQEVLERVLAFIASRV
jgi:thymidylate kinase